MIPILILAGGASSRMQGRDKLLEPIGEIPLLRHVAVQALETGHPVIIALRPDDPPRRAALEGLEVAIHEVAAASEGMSGTLREAVAALPPCPAFMVMLADLPAITAGDMASVLAAQSSHPDMQIWRGATEDGKPGHPIIFASSLRGAFGEITGDEGAKSIAAKYKTASHLVRLPGTRARTDLDTPEDWAAWRGQ